MSNSLLKNAKIIASLFISLTQISLIQPSVVSAEDYNSSKVITNYGGWFEEAYAEWDSSVIGGNVTVSYAESSSTVFTAVDQELIRGDRVDIPGLKGNTQYTVKIEGDKGETQCSVKTLSFDRSGYAHYNYSDIGAYKDDGTLKPDMTVIYVTNENKER